jgi:hypothetical protein
MKSGNNEITRKKAEKEKKEKDNAETQSALRFAETRRRGLKAEKARKKEVDKAKRKRINRGR